MGAVSKFLAGYAQSSPGGMAPSLLHSMEKTMKNGPTPPKRPYQVPESTPAKIALPCSKRMLQADTRMTKELEKIGLSPDEIEMIRAKRDEAKAEAARKKAEKEEAKKERAAQKERKEQEKKEKELKREQDKMEKQRKKEKLAQERAEKKEGGKNERRVGPMTTAMDEFVKKVREGGTGYIQAMREWRQSSERAAILENMSDAEKKRRRYV